MVRIIHLPAAPSLCMYTLVEAVAVGRPVPKAITGPGLTVFTAGEDMIIVGVITGHGGKGGVLAGQQRGGGLHGQLFSRGQRLPEKMQGEKQKER